MLESKGKAKIVIPNQNKNKRKSFILVRQPDAEYISVKMLQN
jgi:hypothetical protein